MKYPLDESEAMVKFTAVLEPEEVEEREGMMNVEDCTEKVCGARFLPLMVKEWKVEGDEMAVLKGKKEEVPKTE